MSSDKIYPHYFNIKFPSSVASMELVGKKLEDGITIFPNLAGKWFWLDQYNLYFEPESDWAANTSYTVKIDKKIFDKNVDVKPLQYKFTTPAFNANLSDLEFQEDPVNPKIKQVIFTLNFTHPVDVEDLYNKLKLKTVSGTTYGFKLTPNTFDRKVYVVSDPIKIANQEDFLDITLKEAKNRYNKETLENDVKGKITIPSSSTFFKLNNVFTNIVMNEAKDNRAEQILFVEFSTLVSSLNLSKHLELYRYDGYCSEFNSEFSKQKEQDITKISRIKPLDYEILPLDNEFSKIHSFKYDVTNPRRVCLISVVKSGLLSEDGFVFNKTDARINQAVEFPTSTKIGFDGSIISMSGDKKLTFISRGVEKIEVNISRIPSTSVNHLISQTYGSFSQPSFMGKYFSEDNISENFKETLNLNVKHPADVNYSSVDLNKYFETQKGIFIAQIKGFQKGKDTPSSSDRRLILVSNLGMIVKDNLNKSHDVFVSDFANQKAVQNAKVEVLGKNGIPVLAQNTNEDGMVSFPDLKDFKQEKEPVAYVVYSDNDFAYIPINRSDRVLDYSRFDVSGDYESAKINTLKAFVFNDRGIYRPGEDANFGIVVRNGDLKIPEGNTIKIEIYNPNNDEVLEKTIKVNKFGFMDFTYSIDKLAKPGNYYITLSVLEESNYYINLGTNEFKVEEFAPDTMKIKSQFIDVPLQGWLNTDKLTTLVTLENLYGNPSIDHEVRANFNMYPTTFSFDKYSDYTFTDPMRNSSISLSSISENLDSVQTDEKGNALFEINLSNYTKGAYKLQFLAQGLEKEGGRSVTANSKVMISPLTHLVGYKQDGDFSYINKDAKRSVDFIAINNTLEKIDINELKIEVFEREYISTLVKQPNGTYKYQSVPKELKLSSNMVAITGDGLVQSIDTSKPGEFYIQIINDKNEVLAKVPYMVAGAKNLTYSLEKNAELKVKLDKEQYINGEDINMQIIAPYSGYGLITIEKDKVYATKWFKADTLSSTQSISLPSNVEGNAYINVAFIRDLGSSEIFMSPLSYAVVPFDINKEKRTINIELDTPTVVKPGEKLKIEYKASKEGKIIIYGVNEGILQVSKYKLPKPLEFFMSKKALRVETRQIMDLILPDAGIVNKLRSTGGDGMEEESLAEFANPFARKDRPVVFWSGVLDVNQDKKSYFYEVPENFNGQIRVMAVSVDNDAFGSAQNTTIVRGDFAMTLSAPFNVVPQDVFEAGVKLTNMVEGSKVLTSNLEIITSDNLEVLDKAPESFEVKERGDASFKFKVKAKEKLGSATISFIVSSQGYRSKMTIHLGIRPSMPYATNIEAGMEKSKKEFKNFLLNLYDEYKVQEIYASTSPLVLAQGLVKYLDKYSYTCTEQTVSKIYPLITLLFDHPHLVEGIDVYKAYDEAIARLKLRQSSNGGFSLFGNDNVDNFVSIYTLEFLKYAKEKGFDVPDTMLKKAIDYAKFIAGQDVKSLYEASNSAYAIYILTKGGDITTNYLINLENYLNENFKKEWKKDLTASYMAASYSLLKDSNKANDIVGYYSSSKNSINDYRNIYLMANHFNDEFKKIREKSIDILLEPLKRNTMNSLSSSLSILALSAYPYNIEDDKNIQFSTKDVSYDRFVKSNLVDISNKEVFTITSNKPFYYVINQQGFAKDLPTTTRSDGIEIVKDILNSKGEVIKTARLGEEVTIRLRIKTTNDEYINNVALVDLTAGCFETVGGSLSVNSGYVNSSEVREERVISYLTASKELKEVTYKTKVIAKGEFVLPPAFATALYDATVKANTKADVFIVNE